MITINDIGGCLFWVFRCAIFPCLFIYCFWAVSKELRREKKARVVAGIVQVGILLSIVVIGLIFLGNVLEFWPPHWLQRVEQRKVVLERVQAAGGWEIIKRDCQELVDTNAMTGYRWSSWSTLQSPPLPDSLAALKPREIDFWPERDGKLSVRIQIFGIHATGGRGVDRFTLKVVCTIPASARSVYSTFTHDPDAKVQYGDHRLTDDVYEVTQDE